MRNRLVLYSSVALGVLAVLVLIGVGFLMCQPKWHYGMNPPVYSVGVGQYGLMFYGIHDLDGFHWKVAAPYGSPITKSSWKPWVYWNPSRWLVPPASVAGVEP